MALIVEGICDIIVVLYLVFFSVALLWISLQARGQKLNRVTDEIHT